MYGILAKNRGMWGCTTWCEKDGEIELYNTREEAQKMVDEINATRSPVNNFTSYFVKEWKED